MTRLQKGDWVRYSEDVCLDMMTEMAVRDMRARRGMVVNVWQDGARCLVDWGDFYVEFDTDTPSLVVTEALDIPSCEEGAVSSPMP